MASRAGGACEVFSCTAFAVSLELRSAASADSLSLPLAAFEDSLGRCLRLTWSDLCWCGLPNDFYAAPLCALADFLRAHVHGQDVGAVRQGGRQFCQESRGIRDRDLHATGATPPPLLPL